MAIMWNGSLVPWLDPSAAPYSGAQAFFFNAGTTTPRTVYEDGGLGQSHDHPVLANASGMFPAIFLPSGDYRLRITDADGSTIWDVDNITAPVGLPPETAEGDTPIELLARTGDFKFRHGTGPHSGWVRAAGRTIGNAASGATERANADCEALFIYLWAADATLAVPGGRGANAASDWAAAKQITLPDARLRALIGMASMGNTASGLIAAGTFDGGENGDTVGATVGAATADLTVEQIPAHSHTGVTSSNGTHSHNYQDSSGLGAGPGWEAGTGRTVEFVGRTTSDGGLHSHSLTTNSTGGGQAHANVQPSMVATAYIKL